MSREFRLLLRVLGADVDGTKKVPFWLSRIRGVGPNFAQAVVKVARISPEARIGGLSEAEISRLEDIKSWKGIRHSLGLKVRGQRTRTTGRSGKAVGVKKKVLMEAARAAATGKKEEKKE